MLQRTNLEHIRVIPALTQSRVREDESCRLIEGEQAFLVLQDKVVSRNIIGELGATFEGRVDAVSGLFINTEIALVGIGGCNLTQILLIRGVEHRQILVENGGIFFLEDATVFSEDFVAVLVILTVLCNLINEEQRQCFDAHFKEFFLFLKVRLDGLSDLDASHILLDNITDNLPSVNDKTARKSNRSANRVNVGDNIAVLVLLHLIGLIVKVVTNGKGE